LGHTHFAIEYLKNPDVHYLGKTLIVIGAGNVAIDAARTAFRHGCEVVTVVCNMDETAVTAQKNELQYAKIDGVKFELNKTVVEIVDEGVIFADSEIYIDENGNKQTKAIPGTQKLYPTDSVIIAIGQGPRSVSISSSTGINVDENGLIAVNESGYTSREGIFAGGDVVTGAKTVVEAVVVSRKVAEAIDKYITNKYNTK
jgi:glutamate synthase (NADPH/NADH) small chain